MRTPLAASLILVLASLGAAAPQTTPGPTERKPNKDAQNMYPRWLCYTEVPGGEASISVDSRGLVHLLHNDGYQIVYRNSAVETRTITGFTRNDKKVILDPGIVAVQGETVGSPDIWAHTDGTLHAVWWHQYINTAVEPNQYKRELFYARKDATNGWSSPAKLTQAAWKHMYYGSQVAVDKNGWVHVIATKEDMGSTQAYPRNYTLTHFALNPLTAVSPGSNPREVTVPNGNPTADSRLAIDGQGNPWVAWESWTGSTTQVYYSQGTHASGSASFPAGTPFGTAGKNFAPDLSVDKDNRVHLVSLGGPTGTFGQDTVYYAGPLGNAGVSSVVGFINRARILTDSRGQVHVLWGREGLNYVARIKTAATTFDPTWHRQEKAAHPGPDDPAESSFGRIGEVSIGANDQIHVIDAGNPMARYTCTLEHNLGVRDGAAMVPALPQAGVNVSNGNLLFTLPLFATKGVAPAQTAALTYNSLDFNPGLIGPGWRFSGESYLIDHKSTRDQVTVFYGDGRPVHFKKNDTWGYLVAEDEFGVFEKAELLNPEYRLTTKLGDTLTFDKDGKLREIKEASGNFIKLVWGAAGTLDQVVDQLPGGGRTTSLQYESATNKLIPTRLKTVTDPGGKVTTLVYSGNHLTEAKFTSAPSVPTWKFEYPAAGSTTAEERQNLPKRILPPRGTVGSYGWKIGYLPDNRVIKVTDPENAELTLTYKEDGAITDPRETRVKNRRTFETLYKVDARRSLVKEIQDAVKLGGNASIKPVVRTFDQYGNLTSVQDRYGFTTQCDYYTSQSSPQSPHVRNNLREVRKPSSAGAPETVVSYIYTPDTFSRIETMTTVCTPIKGQAKRNRATRYSYAPGTHLLERIDFPDVTEPASVNQTAVFIRYEYNGPRNALSRIQNEMGNSTWFSNFDGNGLPMSITRDGGATAVTRQYNAMGLQTQEQQPTGGAGNDAPLLMITTYDGKWRMADTSDGRGTKTIFGYDPDDNLTSVQVGPRTATTTTYDRRGFPSGGAGPDGGWTQTADAHGNAVTRKNERNGTTTSTYDALDRITRSVGPAGTLDYAYDLFTTGAPSCTVTVAGRTTRTEFDPRGLPFRVTAPLGRITQNHYDEQGGLLASEVLSNGALQTCTVYQRDDRDRTYLVRVQNAAYGGTGTSSVDRYSIHNKAGSVIREVDPLGTVSNAADNAPHAVKYRRDVRERVFEIVDGFGVVVKRYLYGDDDKPTEILWPDPGTKGTSLATQVKLTWTGNKEQKSATNRNGKGVAYTYKALPGQVGTITDALSRRTLLDYHPGTELLKDLTEASGTADARVASCTWEAGQQKSITVWNPHAGSNSSTYTRSYDAAFRPTGWTYPAPGIGTPMAGETRTYTAASELDLVTTGSRRIDHNYNALGQNDRSTFTGLFGTVVQDKVWHGIDLLKEIREGTNVHKMDYEVFRGAPTVETFNPGGWQKVQTHTVDKTGNFIDFVDAEGKSHATPVDANNRPLRIAYQGSGVAELKFTSGGLLDTVTLKSATGATTAVTESVYDSLGRKIQSKTVQGGTLKVLSDLRWAYNDVNLVTAYTMAHLGVTFTYAYNARNELTSESTPGNGSGAMPPYTNPLGGIPTGLESLPSATANSKPGVILAVPAWSGSYVLDAAGNRKSQVVNGVTTTFTLNALSQVTRQDRSNNTSTEHQYDEFGNEVKRIHRTGTTITREESFGYNHLNLWSTYVDRDVPGNVILSNQVRVYSPDGQLLEDWDQRPATPVARVYLPRFGEVKTEYSRPSGGAPALANTYLGMGLDGKTTQIAASGTRTHTVGDLVGTISMTLTDAGLPQVIHVKSAFGLQIATQGTLPSALNGIAGSGVASNTGYHFLRNRFYDPAIGRQGQMDPLIANRPTEHYAYAGNNPIIACDPLGLETDYKEAVKYFELLYGKQGMKLLKAFEKTGQWEFGNVAGDVDVDWLFASKLTIQIEKDVDPWVAADLMRQGLEAAMPYMGRTLQNEIKDEETARRYLAYIRARGTEAADVGIAAANLYQAGIGILSEPADLVMSVNDLAQGDWKAIMGVLPFVNAGTVRLVGKGTKQALGKLKLIGGDWWWESTAGLRYGIRASDGETRVAHVLAHGTNNLNKDLHGIFSASKNGILATIDEAWLTGKRVKMRTHGGREEWIIDAGKTIGTEGGKYGRGAPLRHLFMVLKEGTTEVITAYPVDPTR